MKHLSTLLFFLIGFSCTPAFSQAVISESGATTPDGTAILDLQSTSKGLLPPRLTDEQRNAIVNPAPGLTIFNTTSNCTNVYNGFNWFELCGTCTPPAPGVLNYTNNGPFSYCVGETITSNNANTGSATATAFSVTPSLPDGLSIHPTTGQISGTPASESAETSYTITASNSCGSVSRDMDIAVFTVPADPGVVSGNTEPVGGNSEVYSISPVSGSVTYDWTVPADWNITAGEGTNSITVTVGNNTGDVSVEVSNPCGSVSSSLTIVPWGPVVATGGNTITDINVGGVMYRVHSFTSEGTSSFNVSNPGTDGTVQYLVIGGGGGGGGATHSTNGSGGGGAGGYRCSVPGETSGGGAAAESPMTVSAGSYTVTVGAGGSGQSSSGQGKGVNGSNSVFGSIVAIGGGGGCGSTVVAGVGGSGGGGDSFTGNAAGMAARTGAAGTAGQGYAGGNGVDGSGGGGGGGAASAGATAAGGVGGAGGAGRASSITGTSVTRAGGGGACSWDAGTPGNGGSGGGGNAGGQSFAPQSGAPNTGSGGGASKSGYQAGNGGSGIVIIRYPITNPN